MQLDRASVAPIHCVCTPCTAESLLTGKSGASGSARCADRLAGTALAVQSMKTPEAPASNQETDMAKAHLTLALATLLSSAPLFAGVAAAQPAAAPDRAATTVTSEPLRMNRAGDTPASAVPNVDLSAPTTPVPMNLPDEAKASEVKSEYGIGVAGLVLGTLLVAAIVIAGFYFMSRRSWSASH
jgi:hypothetical protein